MNALEFYREGRLDEAVEALGGAIRQDPTDVRSRTFLFELLCFQGEYQRAAKQLDVMSRGGKEAEIGALMYRGALLADGVRQRMFAEEGLPPTAVAPAKVGGMLNGAPFASIEDADPRIGARLEVFAAGRYLWLPFEHVQRLTTAAPGRLRDLLWLPAQVQTTAAFQDGDLGEVLLPVLTPLAWREEDSQVRLGRVTEYLEEADGSHIPMGQKLLLVDGVEVPILEVRELAIDVPEASA